MTEMIRVSTPSLARTAAVLARAAAREQLDVFDHFGLPGGGKTLHRPDHHVGHELADADDRQEGLGLSLFVRSSLRASAPQGYVIPWPGCSPRAYPR